MTEPWHTTNENGPRCHHSPRAARTSALRPGFTLVELLVVIAIATILLLILLPGLSRSRQQAKTVVCGSNIRQIALGNMLYANANSGRYCPGATDFLENKHRWHGTRDSSGEPFDPARGPLVPFLGPGGEIRDCPSFSDFNTDQFAFERGCGGYGYNNAYVGMDVFESASGGYVVKSTRVGAVADRIDRPSKTIMFTDSAFARDVLIEYSFAEPRFQPGTENRADPSIHFRHSARANVAWCDGRVERFKRTFIWSSGFYLGEPDRLGLGWFGEDDDNSLFDLN